MSDPDLELMERELARLKPAPAPERLVARLGTHGPSSKRNPAAKSASTPVWPTFLRWFIPAAAVPILLAIGLWRLQLESGVRAPTPAGTGALASASMSQALTGSDTNALEQVHIDHRLLAAFETVAEVPGRGPVRFRFSEWEDRVVVRAPNSGLSVERRTPRFEIIPISYESY